MKHQASAVLDYIGNLFAPEDTLLQEVRSTFETRAMAIQVGAEEGKLLQVLLKLHGAKTVIEIGTLGGYSAIWMARALPEDGHLHTVEYDPEHAKLARDFIARSDVAGKITVWEGKAVDVLPQIAQKLGKKVDAVFIDADKISYLHYLDWAEENLRQGGLLIGDNTLLFGTVYRDELPQPNAENVRPSAWEAMRSFNTRLADPARYDGILIPTVQGMTVAIKK